MANEWHSHSSRIRGERFQSTGRLRAGKIVEWEKPVRADSTRPAAAGDSQLSEQGQLPAHRRAGGRQRQARHEARQQARRGHPLALLAIAQDLAATRLAQRLAEQVGAPGDEARAVVPPPGGDSLRLRPGKVLVVVEGDVLVVGIVVGARVVVGQNLQPRSSNARSAPVIRLKASPATRARLSSRICWISHGTATGSPNRPVAWMPIRRVSAACISWRIQAMLVSRGCQASSTMVAGSWNGPGCPANARNGPNASSSPICAVAQLAQKRRLGSSWAR